MAIVRTFHDKENPYVILNKTSLWDSNLSLDAIGLWARLMSRPDDWTFNTTEICKSCSIGKDKTWNLLNELIDNGYAYRYQKKENGKFSRSEIVVFETKKNLDDLNKIVPYLANPGSAKSSSTEPALLNIDSTNPPNPPIPSVCINTNTKDKSPLPPSGGEEARPRPGGNGIEISKKYFEESKKALREIKIEVDDEEKFIHPRMIDKLARELSAEEVRNAEAYVAYCLEDPEFEIENLMGFLIHALREKKSPPDSNAITNIEYARQRKKDWKLRSLSIYQDYVYECESCKELSNSMHPKAFREAFDGTFGPKADALMGGSSWGV